MVEKLSKAKVRRGVDVSEYRFDPFERKTFEYALTLDNSSVFCCFGSGRGRLEHVLALLGYGVWSFDMNDYGDHFKTVRETFFIPEQRLRFKQKKLEKIGYRDLPTKISIAVASRVIHYLQFEDAKRFLSIIANRLEENGRIYFSITGIDTVLASNYLGKNKELQNRHDYLSQEMQERFSIKEPVCLYDENDIKKLVSDTGLDILSLEQSNFGNWRVICAKV